MINGIIFWKKYIYIFAMQKYHKRHELFRKHLVILFIPRIFDVDFLLHCGKLFDVSERPKEVDRIPLNISDTLGDFDALHSRTYFFAWFLHIRHIL